MDDTVILRFLYKTVPGRILLKLLVRPEISRLAGRFLSTRPSSLLIPFFIRKNRISLQDIEIPEGGFPSFNAFFSRKRKTPLPEGTEQHLISPCDGLLTIADIREDMIFQIKGTQFSLQSLLKSRKLSERFLGGTALIFRLTPAHYHRYCYAVKGKILRTKKIPGKLHCVRPIAIRACPVFTENAREYVLIRSASFGAVLQMEIGALLVGRIHNPGPAARGVSVFAGEEKGCFEFGGSTILLLCEKGRIALKRKLVEGKNGSAEIPVKIGEFLARKVRNCHKIT
ncbi:MAG: phosphatidylserine decarboxylase [Lachnospiraceae bacterium]|nr:phosphatidylserine decarboxylase [Lachnospiraceae bacterium]